MTPLKEEKKVELSLEQRNYRKEVEFEK